jgi:alkylation response protein AidB-like acyl-CoA dehydrogenase
VDPSLNPAQRQLMQTVDAALQGVEQEADPALSAWSRLLRMGFAALFLAPDEGGLGLGLVESCVVLQAVGRRGVGGDVARNLLVLLDQPLSEKDRAVVVDLARSGTAAEVTAPARGAATDTPRIRDRDMIRSAAHLVGLADRALDLARFRAERRVVGGKPLVEHQAMAHRLARAAFVTRAAEVGVWEAAWHHDNGSPEAQLAPAAVAVAGDAALSSVRTTVQVFGAAGTSDSTLTDLYVTVHAAATAWGSPADLWDVAAQHCYPSVEESA